jgi:hypothetical protein
MLIVFLVLLLLLSRLLRMTATQNQSRLSHTVSLFLKTKQSYHHNYLFSGGFITHGTQRSVLLFSCSALLIFTYWTVNARACQLCRSYSHCVHSVSPWTACVTCYLCVLCTLHSTLHSLFHSVLFIPLCTLYSTLYSPFHS